MRNPKPALPGTRSGSESSRIYELRPASVVLHGGRTPGRVEHPPRRAGQHPGTSGSGPDELGMRPGASGGCPDELGKLPERKGTDLSGSGTLRATWGNARAIQAAARAI